MPNRPRRHGSGVPPPALKTVIIDRLAASGEGMAGDVALPYTLPGETVRARLSGKRGEMEAVLAAAPARVTPPCPHFGPGAQCGGCALQHMDRAALLAWKRARVEAAMLRAGFAVPPVHTHQSPPRSRRRARLALRRFADGLHFGFRQRRSHAVVPMEVCHILTLPLFTCARRFAEAAEGLLPKGAINADLVLTETDTGIDLMILGVDEGGLGLAEREALANFAEVADLARLSVGEIPLVTRTPPAMRWGKASVPVPQGGFLQATADGEAALRMAVCTGVGAVRSVADLFAGIGTFSLPLAATGARVLAAEGAPDAVSALRTGAASAGLAVDVLRRDLFTDPIAAEDLAAFEAVVFDPPRAGAAAQAAAIAEAGVPLVAAVSCQPGTLARDLRAFSAAYDLTALTVVDQFLWSGHIEVVAILRRRHVNSS